MNARFLRACWRVEDLPPPSLAEIAVAGRSNCGKSSLINAVTGQPKLAKTSSTPGRTRQLVYFEIVRETRAFYLVDLPGYGYAKAPRTDQQAWARLINWYIDHRETLTALLLLCDIRREPRQEELDLLRWAAERGLTALVVLTKADKINKGDRFAAAQRAKKALALERRPLVFCVEDRDAVASLGDALLELATAAGTVNGADR